jgi:hypothetical protein
MIGKVKIGLVIAGTVAVGVIGAGLFIESGSVRDCIRIRRASRRKRCAIPGGLSGQSSMGSR